MIVLSIIIGWFISVGYRVYIDAPDLLIGEDYLSRWYLIPRNPIANIYLHRFTASDEDRALHGHPWASLSVLLKGELKEHTPAVFIADILAIDYDDWWEGKSNLLPVTIPKWRFKYRDKDYVHRLVLKSESAWTLFMTGPRVQEWGFYCPKGFVHWRDFTAGKKGNKVGAGCGED